MFESIMWNYIKEESSLLMNLFHHNNIKESLKQLDSIETIYFVAHGSSYNAAVSILPFISKMTGIRAYAYTPSNFIHNAISLHFENKETTCVFGISQTGTSRGVLEALQSAKEKGFMILSITNEMHSNIDQLSDYSYYLQCQEESSNAKTKGYSSTLLILILLGIELGYERKYITYDLYQSLKEECMSQIGQLDEMIEKTISWCTFHQYGKTMENVYVIGNGMNFGTAMEGQLKLMETHLIPTMFNDCIEFSHGMHRSLNKRSHVILLNDGIYKEEMNKTFEYLKRKEIPVCMISTENSCDENIISIPSFPLTSSILLFTCVIQVISAFVPEINGLDPNRDANNDYTDCMETRV